MSPEYVRPYVKSQKNDDRDAEAIAEAATRPTMRFTLAGLVGGISRPMAQQSTWFIRFTTIAANLSAPEIKPLGMMPLFFLGACRSCLGGQRGERVASIRLGRPRQMITQFA